MLRKQYRLSTKDINYILKRRQLISTPDFLFFFVPQYQNRPYNQFAIQISTKLHKRSNKRNKLKRMYYDYLQDHIATQTQSQGFVKTIALPHKTHVENRNKLLDNGNRETVKQKLQTSVLALFNQQSKKQSNLKR